MTIAIIDRHAITRIGIIEVLRQDFQDITILDAPNLDSLLSKFPDQKPDLVIADLSQLEQHSCPGYIQLIYRSFSGAKVLAYDEGGDFLRLQRYLKAGIQGYIFKNNSTSELICGIRQVMAGTRYVCNRGFQMILSNLNPAKLPKASTEFTAAEHEVARCMSEGMEMSGIARRLRSNAAIVKRIQSSVFQKLEMRGMTN
jgi:DNA-binding NarL/FixJ family response regulator